MYTFIFATLLLFLDMSHQLRPKRVDLLEHNTIITKTGSRRQLIAWQFDRSLGMVPVDYQMPPSESGLWDGMMYWSDSGAIWPREAIDTVTEYDLEQEARERLQKQGFSIRPGGVWR